MYSNQSGLIFGFHGCDASLVEDVLLGKTELKQSNNKYDWLGNGIYFWENSPARAHEWAEHLKNNPGQSKNEIKNPAVLGAVIDIGNCLDFTEYSKIQLLKEGYKTLKELFKVIPDAHLPKNKNVKGNSDLLLRELDCAVIEIIHQTRKDNNDLPFDSVKGVFLEGKPAYEGAGFREKTHIQICVRNPNCIKGYFLPREKR